MPSLTFKGGIHTYEGKDLTKDKKIPSISAHLPIL